MTCISFVTFFMKSNQICNKIYFKNDTCHFLLIYCTLFYHLFLLPANNNTERWKVVLEKRIIQLAYIYQLHRLIYHVFWSFQWIQHGSFSFLLSHALLIRLSDPSLNPASFCQERQRGMYTHHDWQATGPVSGHHRAGGFQTVLEACVRRISRMVIEGIKTAPLHQFP